MKHFVQYGVIGVFNTLISLLTVFLLHQLLDLNLELSNFLGFIAGGVNSYVCNRCFNFRSKNPCGREMIRFVLAFIFAYSINLIVLEISNEMLLQAESLKNFSTWSARFVKPGIIANLIANVFYVFVSFFLLKFWVFKSRAK